MQQGLSIGARIYHLYYIFRNYIVIWDIAFLLQAREISVPTSSCSAFPRALKKIAFPRARVPKTPRTRERESRNARPALLCSVQCTVLYVVVTQFWRNFPFFGTPLTCKTTLVDAKHCCVPSSVNNGSLSSSVVAHWHSWASLLLKVTSVKR